MSENSTDPLHLSGLSIRGFRGVQRLEIPKLGRVTLIAGESGIGKTTVLEAVSLYASRGRERVLYALLNKHEELPEAIDEDSNKGMIQNIAPLFNGRKVSADSEIDIGPCDDSGEGKLKIVIENLDKKTAARLEKTYRLSSYDTAWQVLKVSFSDYFYRIPLTPRLGTNPNHVRDLRRYMRYIDDQDSPPSELNFQTLGPGHLNNDKLVEFWDGVVFREPEKRVIRGLNLANVNVNVNGVTAVGDNQRKPHGRQLLAKLQDAHEPVPLRSLGDGAVRLFSFALALECRRDGFLLIDEAENGIHHLVFEAFWRMVLQTAHEYNVQVFATTHSSDCVAGFARAAVSFPEIEGVLVRLEPRKDRTRAVLYSESQLNIAVDQGIEVR